MQRADACAGWRGAGGQRRADGAVAAGTSSSSKASQAVRALPQCRPRVGDRRDVQLGDCSLDEAFALGEVVVQRRPDVVPERGAREDLRQQHHDGAPRQRRAPLDKQFRHAQDRQRADIRRVLRPVRAGDRVQR